MGPGVITPGKIIVHWDSDDWSHRFNGAGSDHSRKEVNGGIEMTATGELQWGRE